MAKLETTQEFLMEMRAVIPKINTFHDAINKSLKNNVWSKQQWEDLVLMQFAVTGLTYALTRLVDANQS